MTDEVLFETKGNSKAKLTPTLIFTVFMICLGSSMIYGFNMSVINLPGEYIKCFLGRTISGRICVMENATAANLTAKKDSVSANFLYAQTSTTFVIAGILGAFSSGFIADKVGRRNGLLFNHAFMIIGGIFNMIVVVVDSAALLYVGRFFMGINSGLTIGVASMYLMEIAPRNLRGAIGACHQLAVTIGIVIGYILTLKTTMNTAMLWPIACGLGALPAFISLVTLPFFSPESPRFLYLMKEDEEGARKSFIKFNQSEDVDIFIGELREEIEAAKQQEKFAFMKLFTTPDLRMPIIIACLIQGMQQLSGINAVITYSSIMMKQAGVDDNYSEYCVLGIGILNVIATIISLPLIEKLGRRTLILWPSLLLAISLVFLTITVTLANSTQFGPYGQKVLGILSVFFIMTYIIGFACGLGPVPAMIVGEIFRQAPRAAAYSVSQGLQWLCNLMVLFFYPIMNEKMGGYSFLPFLFFVVGCWIFFFLFMPETKNRTFDEIAKDLAFGNIVVGKKTGKINKSVRYEKASTHDDHVEIS